LPAVGWQAQWCKRRLFHVSLPNTERNTIEGLAKIAAEWEQEVGLRQVGHGWVPQRDDSLAELSFLAAAGHTSPALGLQSLDLSKLDLRASPVDSVAESDRR
jgi:hypothetical protein